MRKNTIQKQRPNERNYKIISEDAMTFEASPATTGRLAGEERNQVVACNIDYNVCV